MAIRLVDVQNVRSYSSDVWILFNGFVKSCYWKY